MHRLLYTRATLAIGEGTKKGAAGIFVPERIAKNSAGLPLRLLRAASIIFSLGPRRSATVRCHRLLPDLTTLP